MHIRVQGMFFSGEGDSNAGNPPDYECGPHPAAWRQYAQSELNSNMQGKDNPEMYGGRGHIQTPPGGGQSAYFS